MTVARGNKNDVILCGFNEYDVIEGFFLEEKMCNAFDYFIEFRVSDSRGILRGVYLRRSTREYLNEFFPRKLSLSHYREERANGQDISFRDDYE